MYNVVVKGYCGIIGYFLDYGVNVYVEIGMIKGDVLIWFVLICG